jgi:hypothetical protein
LLAAVALALLAALVAWSVLTEDDATLEIRLAQPRTPREIDILIDGVKRCGTTPCLLRDVAPGRHQVTLVMPDGRRIDRRIDLRDDAINRYDFALDG